MKYLLSVSVLLALSCTSMKKQTKVTGSSKPARIKGTSWVLSTIPNYKMEALKKVSTLSFSDTGNRISGFSGCNGFGGVYEVDGEKLKMSQILGTMMACMPGMKTESAVYNALNNTDHYQFKDGKLVLMQGDKVLAEYTPSKK